MPEAEWPKRSYLPAVARRNLSLFLLAPAAVILLAVLLKPDVGQLVLASIAAVAVLLNEFKVRRPIVEAWPDHVNIQRPGTWRLVPIQYAQIRELEEIPHIRFTVFYESTGKKKKVYIPAAYLPALDSCKQLLQTKSGLAIGIRHPWWAWLLTRNGPLIIWDEPGAWMKALLFSFLPLIMHLYGFIGLPLAWRWLGDLGLVQPSPPAGLATAAGLLLLMGSFLLLRRGQYVLVATVAVLLTLFPLFVLWVRHGLVAPLWMWVPSVLAAIGLVMAAVSSQRRQPINH